VRITPEGVGSGDEPWQGVYNPSFDVTPAELISESILFLQNYRLTPRLRRYREGSGGAKGGRESNRRFSGLLSVYASITLGL